MPYGLLHGGYTVGTRDGESAGNNWCKVQFAGFRNCLDNMRIIPQAEQRMRLEQTLLPDFRLQVVRERAEE